VDGRPVDPERVEQARSGDASAFEALVEPRVGPMTRTAMAILGSESEARDAVQDALVIAWRELAALRDPQAFDAWLTRILVNRCRRGLRGVATRRGRGVSAPSTPVGPEPGGPDATASADERGALEQAFERLRVDERTLLVLHHLDGRPVGEIAAARRVPEGTAASRLLAARRSLQSALGREGAMSAFDDEALREMLAARADRLPSEAAGQVMAAVRAEVRGPRQGAAFSVLPVLTGRSPAVGAGWAAAAMVAVLVMAVLATRAPTASPSPSVPGTVASASSPLATSPAPPVAAHISLADLGRALDDGSLDGGLVLVDTTLRLQPIACQAGETCGAKYSLDFVGPVTTDPEPGQPVVPARPADGSTPLAGTFVVVPDRGALILVGRMEGSLASPIDLSAFAGYQPADPGAALALQAISGQLIRNSTEQCSVTPCVPRDFITWAGLGGATNAADVTTATPALGIEGQAAGASGPFLVRTGTGDRLEVVGRYDIGASTVVDMPAISCRLAPGAALPPCATVVAQALASLPDVGAMQSVEVEQGAYCPPGVACPTVEADRAHVIVRASNGDWLIELVYGRDGGLMSAVPRPLPSP
jgi:RNA polymerase sigma-70 factor, ECF subfamily